MSAHDLLSVSYFGRWSHGCRGHENCGLEVHLSPGSLIGIAEPRQILDRQLVCATKQHSTHRSLVGGWTRLWREEYGCLWYVFNCLIHRYCCERTSDRCLVNLSTGSPHTAAISTPNTLHLHHDLDCHTEPKSPAVTHTLLSQSLFEVPWIVFSSPRLSLQRLQTRVWNTVSPDTNIEITNPRARHNGFCSPGTGVYRRNRTLLPRECLPGATDPRGTPISQRRRHSTRQAKGPQETTSRTAENVLVAFAGENGQNVFFWV